MVQPMILTGALKCENIQRLFYDADDRTIARFIAADRARILLRDVRANRTGDDPVFQLHERIRQGLCLFFRCAKQEKCEALCGLGSHTWQAVKFFDQARDRARRRIHY